VSGDVRDREIAVTDDVHANDGAEAIGAGGKLCRKDSGNDDVVGSSKLTTYVELVLTPPAWFTPVTPAGVRPRAFTISLEMTLFVAPVSQRALVASRDRPGAGGDLGSNAGSTAMSVMRRSTLPFALTVKAWKLWRFAKARLDAPQAFIELIVTVYASGPGSQG
jgi:hypothetical protein